MVTPPTEFTSQDLFERWNAFVKKMGEPELVDELGRVVADIAMFAMLVFRSLTRGEQLTRRWKAGAGWTD